MLTAAGYFSAVIMGLILGLIGAGGSILTVPILVYLFELGAVYATAYSLFIVGLTALFGMYQYYTKGLIDIKTGVIFAVPSFAGVFIARKFIIPALPQNILTVGEFVITKDILIMLTFAVVMLLASWSMIRDSGSGEKKDRSASGAWWLIALEGLIVGGITGFVGAGGGFLIIPALVLLAGLEMKTAVGTSLMIIAAKSLFGFLGDVTTLPQIDWTFLLIFSGLSVIGIFTGSWLSNYIPGKKLKPAFGWFVVAIGFYIIYREVLRIIG